MKEQNYIVVQGWMRTVLNLKGSELLAYALIYGFSQDGESVFSGSAKYVADWLGIDRRNAVEVLKRLTDKELIIKQEKIINGVKLVDYRINIIPSDKTSQGYDKTSQGGGDKTSHHNIGSDNTSDNKITYEDVRKKQVDNTMIDNLIYSHTENEKLRETLHTFIEYRKKKRSPMTELAVRMMLKKLAAFTDEEQIDALETSIVSNWEGVFPKHQKNDPQQKTIGKVAHKAEEYDDDFDENGNVRWDKFGL